MYIARGSAFELEAQLHIANDLNYITKQEFELINESITSVKKLINGFIKFLMSKN